MGWGRRAPGLAQPLAAPRPGHLGTRWPQSRCCAGPGAQGGRRATCTWARTHRAEDVPRLLGPTSARVHGPVCLQVDAAPPERSRVCGPLRSSQACRASCPPPAPLAPRPSSRCDSLGTALGAGTCERQVPLETSLAPPHTPIRGPPPSGRPGPGPEKRAGPRPGLLLGRPGVPPSALCLTPGPGARAEREPGPRGHSPPYPPGHRRKHRQECGCHPGGCPRPAWPPPLLEPPDLNLAGPPDLSLAGTPESCCTPHTTQGKLRPRGPHPRSHSESARPPVEEAPQATACCVRRDAPLGGRDPAPGV